jgi:hypothetical protein
MIFLSLDIAALLFVSFLLTISCHKFSFRISDFATSSVKDIGAPCSLCVLVWSSFILPTHYR